MLVKAFLFVTIRLFPIKLIKELAKVEYGVSNYCYKLAAGDGNRYAIQLIKQAEQEKQHGTMLAALAGEKTVQKGGIAQVKKVKGWLWRTQVEGLSARYLFVRHLLKGWRLNDFPLADRLALILVLELISFYFYKNLADVAPWPLKGVCHAIASDEFEHASEISSWDSVDCDRVAYWESRIIESIPFLFIDLCRLILKF